MKLFTIIFAVALLACSGCKMTDAEARIEMDVLEGEVSAMGSVVTNATKVPAVLLEEYYRKAGHLSALKAYTGAIAATNTMTNARTWVAVDSETVSRASKEAHGVSYMKGANDACAVVIGMQQGVYTNAVQMQEASEALLSNFLARAPKPTAKAKKVEVAK